MGATVNEITNAAIFSAYQTMWDLYILN
jgi:hypothetical protein